MDRTHSPHSAHDEMLLARLYGGDVDERERVRALDQMASCPDCATLFADLGAIAAATAALPVPPRPRDFTLTEADAVRLRRRRALAAFGGRLARTRALGGSLVAAGLLGVVVLGSISLIDRTGGAGIHTEFSNAGAPVAAQGEGAGSTGSAYDNTAASPADDKGGIRTSANGAATAGPAQPAASSASSAAPSAIESQAPLAVAGPSQAAVPATPPAAQPSVSGQLGYVSDTGNSGPAGPTAVPAQLPVGTVVSDGGPDARAVATVAFAGLALLGVVLLATPRLAWRRNRRPRG